MTMRFERAGTRLKIMMKATILCLAASSSTLAFSPSTYHHRPHVTLAASAQSSRSEFISSSVAIVLSSAAFETLPLSSSFAATENSPSSSVDGTTAKAPVYSIGVCDVDGDDCVSTASIRDAKGSYSPPWTFETSPDEAFARIKGVLASDDAFVITEVDDTARYVRAYAKRLASVNRDEVEFLVRGDDKVVLYRSTARLNGSVSDFGANRKRIDDIRRRGAVFGLQGDGLTADSLNGGGETNRNNGPWGQLKAFYGLQSGEGFEKLFDEEGE
jgi:uncharacterized protein (DUF1499 family)